ncbi:unnamed protein product, partial [Staurois parvus]
MTLGRKGLTSGVIKGSTVCWLTVCCVCIILETCCFVFLCCVREIQSSVSLLAGERPVLFTYSSLPCQLSATTIARCRQG